MNTSKSAWDSASSTSSRASVQGATTTGALTPPPRSDPAPAPENVPPLPALLLQLLPISA